MMISYNKISEVTRTLLNMGKNTIEVQTPERRRAATNVSTISCSIKYSFSHPISLCCVHSPVGLLSSCKDIFLPALTHIGLSSIARIPTALDCPTNVLEECL